MPPALGGADLKHIALTAAEVEAARKILASGRAASKSKMQGMSNWLKLHNDPTVENSRGEERRRYLEAFAIVQMRAKDVIKKSEHVQKSENSHEFHNKWEWLCKQELDTRRGETSSKLWRESGKLQERNCPVTGSDHVDAKEWRCPKDWETFIDAERNGMAINTIADASEADLGLLAEMRARSHAASSDSQTPPPPLVDIKKEKLTEAEQDTIAYRTFVDGLDLKLKEIQEMQAGAATLLSRLAATKYTADLQNDIRKHSCRVSSLVRLLLRAKAGPLNNTGY